MKGHLIKWDYKKAFGFIAPDDGSENIFIHISDFRVKDYRPKIGDVIMYEVGRGKDGKKKAIRAYSENIKTKHSVSSNRTIHPYNEKKSKRRRLFSSRRITFLILLVIMLVLFGKFHFFDDLQSSNVLPATVKYQNDVHEEAIEETSDFNTFMKEQEMFRAAHTREKLVSHSTDEDQKISNAYKKSKYRCDGRQYCSQMHSCAEATYFINNCPNTKMDGDGDGIPCESQWCGH